MEIVSRLRADFAGDSTSKTVL